MKAKVVALAKRRLDPAPEVVAGLKAALARARSGEIRGYALATSCDAGSTGTSYEIGDGTIPQLVCSIERLKLRLLEHGG